MATWSPKYAPHVVGTFERAVDEDGKPEPTWVVMKCGQCGGEHRVKCESGAPTQWIQKFATLHLHRDPLNHEFPKQEKKE